MNDRNDYLTILLDIKSEIGSLSARMMDASRSRERMEKGLDEVKDTIAGIKPVVEVVTQMKPEHDDLMKFKDRIGGYVWLAGGIATGALILLWQGIQFFSDNIKAALSRVFH